jgi:hypothetical protein
MKVCGTPYVRPVVSHSERRKALAEGKAGGAVVGVVAGDATIQQQAAQRHHERLQAHPRDQEAVDQADDVPATSMITDRQWPGQVIGDQQVDENHAEQAQHRADRQVDAAVMITRPSPSEKQPEQARSGWQVLARLIGDRKRGLIRCDDRADDQNQAEKPRSFLSMAVPNSSSCRRQAASRWCSLN